jgi:putative transposase
MTPRKPYRSDLTEAQWQRIKRLLPKAKITGRPRGDEREVINGILYVLSTGCRWEELPHHIGASGTTCNRRLLD